MLQSKKNKTLNFSCSALFLILILFTSSCRTSVAPYFLDLKDSTNKNVQIPQVSFVDPKIQSYDILDINVQTLSENASTGIFQTSGDVNTNDANTPGYRVDKEGFIELPVLGRIKIAGLTLLEARELVRERAQKFYVDPVVQIHFANFRVTVLGDVNNPGIIKFNTEKVSIMDVISEVGDLQITGIRSNVLVIREEGNHRSFGRINLNSSAAFQSPYFYLQSGDIVYVEANKAKERNATIDRSYERFISYATSVVSLTISIYTWFIIRR